MGIRLLAPRVGTELRYMPPETLSEMVDTVAAEHPDREALVADDRRLTYAEFRERTVAFARGLVDLGVGKGDHVGVLVSTRPEWFVATYALQYLGATAVGLNTWYSRRELERMLQKTEVSTLVTMDSFEGNAYLDTLEGIAPELTERDRDALHTETLPFLRRVVVLGESRSWTYAWEEVANRADRTPEAVVEAAADSVSPYDPAFIMFSSGTTGEPKAIVLKHDGLVTNPVGIGSRLDVTPEDRFWDPVPLFFSLASCHETITALYHGATIVLQERFDAAEAVDLIEREECTIMYGVHNMFRQIEALDVDLPESFESVRLLQGMAPPAVRERFVTDYGVDDTVTGYGLTETSAVATLLSTDDPFEKKLNTNGHPLPNADVRIRDPETGAAVPRGEEGEVYVRGRTLFEEYYNQPELTERALTNDGYLATGDLGRLDEDGRLVFEGRLKEMIKTSGINVSPKEVRNVLVQHPDVEDAVVFGLPDDRKDEIVAGAVLSERELEREELVEFCRDRLASYKIPEVLEVMESFPRTASGKTKTQAVRERFDPPE